MSQARDDLWYCTDMMTAGSSSFTWASHLLPTSVRNAAIPVYAFCRLADDLVDDGADPGAALDVLRARLDRIYRSEPQAHPVDRALARVVRRHALPRAPLDALLEGFAWDADSRTYETLDDLIAYCVRVASSVGVMMTLLMGRRDPEIIARACDLGIAMQLTNIARDVGEDARAGRCYLPLQWVRKAGMNRDLFLGRLEHSPRLGALVADLLKVASNFYERSETGIGQLPRSSRTAIWAARLIYADIGTAIRENGFDSVTQRAHTTSLRKLVLLHLAAVRTWVEGTRYLAPQAAHPAAQFLVDAVTGHSAGTPAASTSTLYPAEVVHG